MVVSLSVVIPCFPRDTQKLKSCLDSIENQTLLPKEVIISHSEITEEQCEKIIEKLNYSFDILFATTLKQCWAAENRNRGCKKVTTEYISFIDADDKLFPERIEIIWNTFKKYDPLCIVHGFTRDRKYFTQKFNKNYSLTFGKELYNLAEKTGKNVNRLDLPLNSRHWYLNGKIHHGHSSIKSCVINSVKFREEESYKKGQDSLFIRDILKEYPDDDKTMIYIDLPLSFYIPA